MRITLTVEVEPWTTPNYVTFKTTESYGRTDGSPKKHIKEVDAETLHQLCKVFRAEVFEKAGAADPYPGFSS